MTTCTARDGDREAKRPARERTTVTSHTPKTAMSNRPNVCSATYQCRGRKKDGTKCLSRNCRLATIAQARKVTPIDETTISAIKRVPKCSGLCTRSGGIVSKSTSNQLMRLATSPDEVLS